MEKQKAEFICRKIEEYMSVNHIEYGITRIDKNKGSIQGFHQWANGKPLIAGYHIFKHEDPGYFLLFIDWHRNNRYYLVLYPYNKSTTLAELQTIDVQDGKEIFIWKYNPLKRDGKNQQRKSLFKQMFGSTDIQIPIPNSINDVPLFFDQLILLCLKRIKADRTVDFFE